jgi:hypothetical protein
MGSSSLLHHNAGSAGAESLPWIFSLTLHGFPYFTSSRVLPASEKRQRPIKYYQYGHIVA